MKITNLILIAGLFGFSAKAQTTWYEIPVNTSKKLNTVSFPSSTVGYIGGNDSLLMKTTDGGETWNPIPYSGVTFYPGGEHIINLKFVSATTGFMAVGPYNGTYKTTNGGLTWTPLITSGNLCFNEGLFFFDEQNGFIGGSGCFQGELIDKMTAGTISAATINSSTNDAENRVVDIDFYDTDFGLAVSRGGYILRTVNGGSTWDTIPSTFGSAYPLTSIVIINDTVAYAGYDNAGSGFGLLKTTDAGLTWDMDMESSTFYYPAFLSLHESGDESIYSGALSALGQPLIFEWTALTAWYFYDMDQPVYEFDSYGDSVVFGVGDSGYVVVNQPLGILGIEKSNTEESSFEIYPNPANDQVFIRTTQSLLNPIVTITSISGKMLHRETLIDNSISIEHLPAGIYIMQLVSGTSSSVQRFVKN